MSDEMKVQTKGLNKKFLFIAIALIAVGLVAALVLLLPTSAKAKKVEEQLNLGAKYLSELDYEQAIVAYEAVIKIDPKCEEAYLALADIYIATGELEKAEEILKQAEEALGAEATNAVSGKKKEVAEVREEQNAAEVLTGTPIPSPTELPTLTPTSVPLKTPTAIPTPAPTVGGNIHQISVKMAENERYTVIGLGVPQWTGEDNTILITLVDENGKVYKVEAWHAIFLDGDGNNVETGAGFFGYFNHSGPRDSISIQVKVEEKYVYYTFDKSALGAGISKLSIVNFQIYADNKQVYFWNGEYEIEEELLKYAVLEYWNNDGLYPIEHRQNDKFRYSIYNTGEVAVSGIIDTNQTEVIIPETIDGMRVTGVLGNFGLSNRNISTVVMPDSITWIESGAFGWCENLSKVKFSNTLLYIGEGAFYNCALTELELPESLKWIKSNAFEDSIASSYQGNYEDICIKIPNSVVEIGEGAFSWNERLIGFELAEENENFELDRGVLYTKGYEELLCMPPALMYSRYQVREECRKIAGSAFIDCDSLEYIVIPASVEKIGEQAFYGCENLKEIDLPESLTKIDFWAFGFCESLQEVVIPEAVTEIGAQAFADCTSLQSVYISKNLREIATDAFDECYELISFIVDENNECFDAMEGVLFDKLHSKLLKYPAGKTDVEYSIPEGVTEIEANAFLCSNNLVKVRIPQGVVKIGESAFQYSRNLEDIVIPNTIEQIGRWAFDYTKWREMQLEGESEFVVNGILLEVLDKRINIAIQKGVVCISEYAFGFLDELRTVTLPEGVTRIESFAFPMCTVLEKVEIPESVKYIGDEAFWGCDNVVIYAPAGSYTEQWAKENGISVVVQ